MKSTQQLEMRRREKEISDSVSKFIEKKYKSECTSELTVLRSKFDVIGFNKETRDFYIVESKMGDSPTSIGHAFGQILAYRAVIEQHGHELLERFFQVKPSHDFSTYERIIHAEQVRVHFFVALTEQACNDYGIIEAIKKEQRHTGILCYKRGNIYEFIRDTRGKDDYEICKSEAIPIRIAKTYERADFLREVASRIKERYPDLTDAYTEYFLQLRFGVSPFHLELHLGKEAITISLDVEAGSDRRYKDEFFRFIHRKKSVYSDIENLREKKDWLKKGAWGRLFVVFEQATPNEEFVNKSVETLSRFYRTFVPLVKSFAAQVAGN